MQSHLQAQRLNAGRVEIKFILAVTKCSDEWKFSLIGSKLVMILVL